MRIILYAIIAIVGIVYAVPRPMETLNRYNVVLVHGAAPETKGFESECNSGAIRDAYTITTNYIVKPDSFSWNLGDAVGMLGAYDRTFNPNKDEDYNESSAKKLTYWLDSAVFEDTITYGSEYIYLQRAFANPAASPAHNAHEIGDRTWKGNNNCSVRRSLFEEAQEVRTEGKYRLQQLRTNSVDEYRTIPSRNILIAHSMGGVVAREYVQSDYYNDDVDKIVTLDSPHEGTGALNMQLGLLLFCSKIRRKSFKENRA